MLEPLPVALFLLQNGIKKVNLFLGVLRIHNYHSRFTSLLLSLSGMLEVVLNSIVFHSLLGKLH